MKSWKKSSPGACAERTYFLVHSDGGTEEDEEGGSQKGEAQEQDDGVEDFLGPGEPLNVGHFGLAGVVEYINFRADWVQFQQGAFGKVGEGVLPEVEFQHAGEVFPGGQVRGDVGFDPVEGGRKGLGDSGAEFWTDNGVGAAVCRVFHHGQTDVVVANGGIADDGTGGFDGAELGVVFFAVVQEVPHQQGGNGESQRVESPENVPIHFNHNPFFSLNRWARHAKVELSSAAGFSGLSVPQIGAGRKNWKDETFF